MTEVVDPQGALLERTESWVMEFLVGFLSPHTRKAYKRDLTLFYFFLREKFPQSSLKEVSPFQIAVFREHLLQSSYATRTVRRILDSLGSFYQFLVRRGVIPRSPMEEIDRPTCSREIVTPDVTNKEVQQILDAVDLTKKSGPLHRAVLSLLFYTGLRSEELRKLKVKNLHFIKGKFALILRGKGDKERTLPVPPPLQKDLVRYLKWRRGEGDALDSETPLFSSSQGGLKPLAARSLFYIVKTYSLKGEVAGSISPHSTRATFIGASLEAGIPLEKVAHLVGHQDVNLTRSYSKRRELLNTFDKLPDLYSPEEMRE